MNQDSQPYYNKPAPLFTLVNCSLPSTGAYDPLVASYEHAGQVYPWAYSKTLRPTLHSNTNIIAISFAKGIGSTTTRGKWMMLKQILLSITIRTLTGRADILTSLNRYGYCLSYSNTLELETAIAYQVQQTDSILSSNILRQNTKLLLFAGTISTSMKSLNLEQEKRMPLMELSSRQLMLMNPYLCVRVMWGSQGHVAIG